MLLHLADLFTQDLGIALTVQNIHTNYHTLYTFTELKTSVHPAALSSKSTFHTCKRLLSQREAPCTLQFRSIDPYYTHVVWLLLVRLSCNPLEKTYGKSEAHDGVIFVYCRLWVLYFYAYNTDPDYGYAHEACSKWIYSRAQHDIVPGSTYTRQ